MRDSTNSRQAVGIVLTLLALGLMALFASSSASAGDLTVVDSAASDITGTELHSPDQEICGEDSYLSRSPHFLPSGSTPEFQVPGYCIWFTYCFYIAPGVVECISWVECY